MWLEPFTARQDPAWHKRRHPHLTDGTRRVKKVHRQRVWNATTDHADGTDAWNALLLTVHTDESSLDTNP